MKVYLYSPWNNRWKKPFSDLFVSRGIEAKWITSEDDLMWADTLVTMWADQFTIEVSKVFPGDMYTYVRSYEVYENYCNGINWEKIKGIFFCSTDVQKLFNIKFGSLVPGIPQHYVKNWLDINEFPYKEKQHGKNIAMICSIHWKKNIGMAFQILNQLSTDYSLHVAGHPGDYPDEITITYLANMAKSLNLGERLIHYGHIDEDKIKDFLEDKNYILSTSLKEGCPMNVLEAMSMGVKPVIHDWPGALDVFPPRYVFNSIPQAISMFSPESEYCSQEYSDFVEENHSSKNAEEIINIIQGGN